MHHTLIKTIILTAILALTRQDLYVSPSNCAIYYDTNLITYTYLNCYDGNNYSFNSWSDCQKKCCPNVTPTDFSSIALKECQGTKSDSAGASTLRIIVALCVLVCIIVSLLVICNRYKAYQHRIQMEKLQESLAPHQKGNLTSSIEDQKWVQEEKVIATSTSLSQNIKEEVSCSICLDPKTTVRLICQHDFHEDCAGKWFQKNLSCPMCRLDVHFIKIKCERLCKRYMLLRWEDYESACGELSKACPKCIQTEKDLAIK